MSDSLQSMDCSPQESSVRGVLQARILERVSIPFSRGSSQPRDGTRISYVSYTADRFLTIEPPGLPWWLTQQKSIFSPSWRLRVGNQGVGSPGFFRGLFLGLQMTALVLTGRLPVCWSPYPNFLFSGRGWDELREQH